MNATESLSLMMACMLMIAVSSGEEAKPANSPPPKFFPAQHGYDGGLTAMVDLRTLDGFDEVRTIDELAAFAAKVPGAIGFTAHPGFVGGKRYAKAVLWYTRRSKLEFSWQLNLFDAAEARKKPGEAPKLEARIAAEQLVSAQLPPAEELIKKAGASGVSLGDHLCYEDKKTLALAVMHLGGFFAHSGQFGTDCGGCRSVVPGGIPEKCAEGIRNVRHWSCCGAEAGVDRCRYWELIKAQDDVGPK